MRRLLVVLVSVGFLLVGAQPANPKGDQISYIAQVQSILEASLYLHAKGDAASAKRVVAGITRRWERARADLGAADRKVMEDGFKALVASIDAKEPTSKYQALVEELDAKMAGIIGAKLEAKDAGVALDRMLIDAAYYYGVAVEGDKVSNPRTHATAAMFVSKAMTIASKAGMGAEVQDSLEKLKQRSLAVANPNEVRTLAAQGRAAVGKAANFTPVPLSNQLYLDRARSALKKVGTEYTAGRVDQALKAMAEVSLDGFEYLEGPISDKNDDLGESLEKQVEDTIAEAIKGGKPASEVSKLVADLMAGLDKAAALLGLK